MPLISLKQASTPLELKVLDYLKPRMDFSVEQKLTYKNLRKGFEGERKLHNILVNQLSTNYIFLNDLLLEVDRMEFQIDTLLLSKDRLYLLEVKNYEGDFYLEHGNWFSVTSKKEIRNPLHQLKRSELLLQKLLQELNYNLPITPYIIFINPEFHLYQATLELPIIFPTQIKRFISNLNEKLFNQTTHQKDLATIFMERNLYQSTKQRLPIYQYEELRKGIVCRSCSYFLETIDFKKLICKNCSKNENVESAIMRNVDEFITLFPKRKITTNNIHDWCYIIESKKTIRRILKKHLNSYGKGKYTHYTFKT